MERLTEKNDETYFHPHCFEEKCIGVSETCSECESEEKICIRLGEYEDTGLTPEQIQELKERDTAKAPKICKNKHSDAYTCPNCALALINKDETGWFCGKHYKFCPDCGQRIKWEE